ncbi:MAG: hypothetical protein PVH19_00150 [Planctomycetia bacterium]|jgi:hypothetical protein
MDRAHIFFDSLEAFLRWKNKERPLYAMQTQRIESTSMSGMTRITHSISVSQVFSEVIHHLVCRVSTHIEPIAQHERTRNATAADLAWDLLRSRLDDQFNTIVSGALVAYPHEVTPIYAGLPADIVTKINRMCDDNNAN